MKRDDIVFVRSDSIGRVRKHPNATVVTGLEVTELAFEDGWELWFEVQYQLDAAAQQRAWADTVKESRL